MVTLPATVQQAVTARTGQAFIDGQTSNEAQFKYLMNNALASKTELNLSVGVSLTAEQVAALTHDIVWMENAVVNGETVPPAPDKRSSMGKPPTRPSSST
nr:MULTISPECIES: hypothetical protein [Pseudomonas]